ncbi:MAG: aldose 1-epimerase family protein, partial [Clostridia bacterium]
MNYTISNDSLVVEISSLGAELMSIKSKGDGTEYLWQGDKTYWGGRAYNLFPICGRLTDGKYTYGGNTYEMNLHGFLRKTELVGCKIAENEVDFCLVANEKTLSVYPFNFEYHILYILNGDSIDMEISVCNHDGKDLYFALGGHPGFNVPLSNDKFEDYYIEFGEKCNLKSLSLSSTCYTLRNSVPFKLQAENRLHMRHNLFDNDAIILEDVCHTVTLKSNACDKSVTLKTPEAMKYLGIWHAPKTEAPYVCLEPWTSVPAYDGEV